MTKINRYPFLGRSLLIGFLFFAVLVGYRIHMLNGDDGEKSEHKGEGLPYIYQVEQHENVVTSDFYGFTITLPEEWEVVSPEGMKNVYDTENILQSFESGELSRYPLALSTEYPISSGSQSAWNERTEEIIMLKNKLISDQPPSADEILNLALSLSPGEFEAATTILSPEEKQVIQGILSPEHLSHNRFSSTIEISVGLPMESDNIETYILRQKGPILPTESGLNNVEDVQFGGKTGKSLTYTESLEPISTGLETKKIVVFDINGHYLEFASSAYCPEDQALIDQALSSISFVPLEKTE